MADDETNVSGVEENDGSSGSGDTSESTGNASGETGTHASGDESGSSEKTYSAAEFEALQRRMQAADRAKAAAEAKVKEFETKDLSELEKAKTDLAEAREAVSQRDARVSDLQLELAFFKSNKVQWHDPALARKEIDMSLVTVEDDGTVKGMDKALEKLAKDKPFLVKTEEKKQASGASFNGGGGKKVTTDKEKLAAKFPALRGRGGNG